VEGKEKIFIVKWDSLCKNVGQRKFERNIGTNVNKRINIVIMITCMPQTISCLLLVAMEILLPNLQMEW
jgi:hypothetical protein